MRDSNHKDNNCGNPKLSQTDPTAKSLILLIFAISNNKIRKGIEKFNTKIKISLIAIVDLWRAYWALLKK
jgi:hypothetical protein